jgi:hypothetical protein
MVVNNFTTIFIKRQIFMGQAPNCKDCNKPIYVDDNMVMIKDELWNKIVDDKKIFLCDLCMEERLGRKITQEDFKSKGIPCNQFWLWYKRQLTEI